MSENIQAKNVDIKIENLPESQVKINFVVPAEELEKLIDKSIDEFSKSMKVDGFRSGKIPRDIVEKQVGKERLLYEGAQKAVQKFYVDAVLDKKIQAIGEPKIELTKVALGNDLEFSATVAVLPEIELSEWKPDVKNVNEKFRSEKIEVKDDEIQRELEFLAKQRAKIITVNRKAANGDQVEMDFEVWMNNAPIENGTAKKHILVIGEGKFIPGFEDHLVGMALGDEKEFELAFPKEYHQKSLAGEIALFKVKVNLVQERQIPEIDDEFASSIGKFKTLEELKSNLREGIAHEAEGKKKEKNKLEVIEKMIEKTEVVLPEILVEKELDKMFHELEHNVAMLGIDTATYLSQAGTSEESLRQQWKKKDAPERVKAALILKKVSEDQEISPDAKEIEEKLNSVLQYYKNMGSIEDKLDIQHLYEITKANLTNEKVFDYLLSL